ncbi:Hypothetical predicted protein [Pelobates cultripes]|uniref:Uncharacterized protein n=1 Tax=Pelobates cultripes TaxID=61616 RepID=A0AAD1QXU3_PELCU|nr:Hypothetical predicted protein [Pelobates cultripes]
MPFTFQQTGRKVSHKAKAYPDYRALEMALYSAALSITAQPAENKHTDPDTMGRKSQRTAAGACKYTHDISAMLQRPAGPKMAATPDPETNSTNSDHAAGDTLDLRPPHDIQADPDALTPATKLDIKNLLLELKQMSAADMAIRKTGIPDNISQSELPHYLRRLVATILPHAQAKKLAIAEMFRIRKSPQAPPQATRDVIVRCHTRADRNAIFAALKGKTPLDFESASLTFYQDLTRSTVQWRRNIRPVTRRLQDAKVIYRWKTPKTLSVDHNGTTLHLTSSQEADSFLQALKLPPRPDPTDEPTSSHTWDPTRTVPFVPRRREIPIADT